MRNDRRFIDSLEGAEGEEVVSYDPSILLKDARSTSFKGIDNQFETLLFIPPYTHVRLNAVFLAKRYGLLGPKTQSTPRL